MTPERIMQIISELHKWPLCGSLIGERGNPTMKQFVFKLFSTAASQRSLNLHPPCLAPRGSVRFLLTLSVVVCDFFEVGSGLSPLPDSRGKNCQLELIKP